MGGEGTLIEAGSRNKERTLQKLFEELIWQIKGQFVSIIRGKTDALHAFAT